MEEPEGDLEEHVAAVVVEEVEDAGDGGGLHGADEERGEPGGEEGVEAHAGGVEAHREARERGVRERGARLHVRVHAGHAVRVVVARQHALDGRREQPERRVLRRAVREEQRRDPVHRLAVAHARVVAAAVRPQHAPQHSLDCFPACRPRHVPLNLPNTCCHLWCYWF